MKQGGDNFIAAGFGKEFAWLDLANSVEWNGYGKLTDHLQDPSWATHIVKHWNLASSPSGPVPLGRLIALRALLRRMAAKLIAGDSLDERDLNALNSIFKGTGARKVVPAPTWSALRTGSTASGLVLDTFPDRGVVRGNARAESPGPPEVLP